MYRRKSRHVRHIDGGSAGDPDGAGAPFPEARTGDRGGDNGLFRLNFFNGRFLTGEALRKEQVYWDTRSRLVAQIHPAGIAWGLDLIYPAPNARLRVGTHKQALDGRKFEPPPGGATTGGLSLSASIKLDPGLAFDGVGRPIVVGTAFDFTLGQLIESAKTRPRRVVGGGTQFSPCVCLDDLRRGTIDQGPSLKPGPYLLVIEPAERPEGEAKVYGEVCAGSQGCDSDGWRGRFELSLAWFPTDPPQDDIQTVWDLRGVLSAYYFDVYEHDLTERWDAPFPRERFAAAHPFERVPGAVALAMLFIGADGSVLFIDPWIPRRPQIATASAAWAENVLGAPTPAACVARLNQFQTQLAEALVVERAGENPNDPGLRHNLYEMGFRHIPPAGFLPVDVPDPSAENLQGKQWTSESSFVGEAIRQARAYFQGTSVLTFGTVAPIDDDVLEDFTNAWRKDPIPLFPREHPNDLGVDDVGSFLVEGLAYGKGEKNPGLKVFLALIRRLFRVANGVTMESLINREISVVRLMVPMAGRRRVFPIVGRVAEDPISTLFEAWGRAAGSDFDTNVGNQVLGDFFGLAAHPRPFVVYVKQRIVLLDVLYFLLDFFLDLLALAAVYGNAMGRTKTPEPEAEPEPAEGEAGEQPVGGEEMHVELELEHEYVDREPPVPPEDFERDPHGRPPSPMPGWYSFTDKASRPEGAVVLGISELRALTAKLPLGRGQAAEGILDSTVTRAALVEVAVAFAPELGTKAFWDENATLTAKARRELAASGVPSDELADRAREAAVEKQLDLRSGAGVLKAALAFAPEAGVVFANDLKARATRAGRAKATATTYGISAFPHESYASLAPDGRRVADLARKELAGARVGEVVEGLASDLSLGDVLSSTPDALRTRVGATAADRIGAKTRAIAKKVTDASRALSDSGALADPEAAKQIEGALAAEDPQKALAALAKKSRSPAGAAAVSELVEGLGADRARRVFAAATGKA